MEGNPQQCYQVLMYLFIRNKAFHPPGSSSSVDQRPVKVVDLPLLRRQSLGALVPGCIHCSSTPQHSMHTISSGRGMGWGQSCRAMTGCCKAFVLLSYLSGAGAQRSSASCANMNFAFANEKSFAL